MTPLGRIVRPNLACAERVGYCARLKLKWLPESASLRRLHASALRIAAMVAERSELERWVVVAPAAVEFIDRAWLRADVRVEVSDASEIERALGLLTAVATEVTTS